MLTPEENGELERETAEEIRRFRRYWRAMRDTEDAALETRTTAMKSGLSRTTR